MTDLTDRLWAGDSLSDDEWRYLIEGDYENKRYFMRRTKRAGGIMGRTSTSGVD